MKNNNQIVCSCGTCRRCRVRARVQKHRRLAGQGMTRTQLMNQLKDLVHKTEATIRKLEAIGS